MFEKFGNDIKEGAKKLANKVVESGKEGLDKASAVVADHLAPNLAKDEVEEFIELSRESLNKGANSKYYHPRLVALLGKIDKKRGK